MSNFDRLPILKSCCGCVTDIKAATAIIAVLVIVTSPIVSWAVVRHGYVVRVSCAITTDSKSPDVVDISLNNALGFGFGANAGLVASCLTQNGTRNGKEEEDNVKTVFVNIVKYSGWIVLVSDVVFLINAVNLLSKMYKRPDEKPTHYFLVSGLVSVILTFIYGLLYVAACLSMKGSFPIFEFIFAFIDFIVWMHFLSVVYSYYQLSSQQQLDNYRLPKAVLMILGFVAIYGLLTNYVWIYYLMVVFSYRRRNLPQANITQ